MTKITKAGFSLLSELAMNNNRDWYTAHKDDLKAKIIQPLGEILETISERLMAHDMDFRGGPKTVFRMNRDIRFSKDKSPYKTNVSGMLTPSGDRSERNGFVYMQMDPKGGFAAFGRYNLRPAALGPIRDRILEESRTFEKILEGLREDSLDLVRADTLKSMPRGYSEHDQHEFADELKLKNMMVRTDLTKKAFTSGDVINIVSDTALKCQSFIRFVSV